VDPDLRPYYLLIQRGKEPNRGLWSLPGGSIEFGEGAVMAGCRELAEETVWGMHSTGAPSTVQYDDADTRRYCSIEEQQETNLFDELHWYPGTVTTSDAVGEGYHYLIAHCFAELLEPQDELPRIEPADDAADANWFTFDQISDMERRRITTPGVTRVVERIQDLADANVLPTSIYKYLDIRYPP